MHTTELDLRINRSGLKRAPVTDDRVPFTCVAPEDCSPRDASSRLSLVFARFRSKPLVFRSVAPSISHLSIHAGNEHQICHRFIGWRDLLGTLPGLSDGNDWYSTPTCKHTWFVQTTVCEAIRQVDATVENCRRSCPIKYARRRRSGKTSVTKLRIIPRACDASGGLFHIHMVEKSMTNKWPMHLQYFAGMAHQKQEPPCEYICVICVLLRRG